MQPGTLQTVEGTQPFGVSIVRRFNGKWPIFGVERPTELGNFKAV
jgi:hypothetical protein